MQNKTIHGAVWDWMQTCSKIKHMFFNFVTVGDGNAAIQPTDTLVEEYIDGTQLRRYAVELIIFEPATFEADDTGNIDMLSDVDEIAEWIKSRADAEDFPDFPDGCTITEITVLETNAGYALAHDGSRAKYMLPFAIDYIKE